MSKNCYDVGTFAKRITVLDQQTRSLNLVYLLEKFGAINADSEIAIIGGGISGVTVASALLERNLSVSLFEKEQVYFNVQLGCQIRELHPNIYNWPSSRSTFPYAELPILSWKAGTANDVVNELHKKFRRIEKRTHRYTPQLGHRVSSLSLDVISNKWMLGHTSKGGSKEINEFDIVIITTGFGVEQSNFHGTTDLSLNYPRNEVRSYWRNDEISQTNLSDRGVNYLVTGIGDGAITDMCRILFFNFSQTLIINKLRKTDNWKALKDELLDIRIKFFNRNKNSQFVLGRFNSLKHSGLLRDLFSILHNANERNSSIRITVNSRGDNFGHYFDLSQKSLFNCLMLFCIRELGCVNEFIQYPLELSNENGHSVLVPVNSVALKGKYTPINANTIRLVCRHGTDREATLKGLGLSETLIEKHKNIQSKYWKSNIEKRLWEVGWYSLSKQENGYVPQFEYFTSDTSSIFYTFISSITKLIEKFHESNQYFRVTMHRHTTIQGRQYYQQICEYAGSEMHSNKVGRVFPIDAGLTGFTFKYGLPAVIEKTDSECWNQLWNLLKISSDGYASVRTMREDVGSIFTLPIIADHKGQMCTNLVLYLDSDQPNFFTTWKESNLIELLIYALQGFLSSVNKLIDARQLINAPVEYEVQTIFKQDSFYRKVMGNACCNELFIRENVIPIVDVLSLREFRTFDLITSSSI